MHNKSSELFHEGNKHMDGQVNMCVFEPKNLLETNLNKYFLEGSFS